MHQDMPSDIDFVAVGASAGGVEALTVLLQALPPDFPLAIAVVLHIPPGRLNPMPALFAERCSLPVVEAVDKDAIKAGTVYFAPADYHLLVEPDGTFALSVDAAVHYSRPSIDLLFESAAESYGNRMLGIVLTGASADGAAGLRAVRAQGGRAWVQDPDTARSAAMPRAAIEIAGADDILELSSLAANLSRLASHTR